MLGTLLATRAAVSNGNQCGHTKRQATVERRKSSLNSLSASSRFRDTKDEGLLVEERMVRWFNVCCCHVC